MDNGIKLIEKQMDALKASVLDRFEKKAQDLRTAQEQSMASYSAHLIDEKDKLLKEIDDRLALIKQFPSVLDADLVNLFEVEGKHKPTEIRIYTNHGDQNMYLDEGEWKILILAKRIR